MFTLSTPPQLFRTPHLAFEQSNLFLQHFHALPGGEIGQAVPQMSHRPAVVSLSCQDHRQKLFDTRKSVSRVHAERLERIALRVVDFSQLEAGQRIEVPDWSAA